MGSASLSSTQERGCDHVRALAPPRNEVAPTLTVSMDAFNVFNQLNYTSFVGNENSPFFGQAVSAQPPRRLQFSARFAF